MTKFFIDGGGYDGCSVRKFRHLYDPNLEYFIYSFEPNKIFNKYYDFEKHSLINSGIYIKNGELDFYLDNIDYDGSSIYLKSNIHNKTKINISVIDFSEWLSNLIIKHKPSDIILKLDIEGAEYQVLNKLIDTNLLRYIKNLFIEWHEDRLLYVDIEEYKKIKLKVTDYCTRHNISIKEWDAIPYRLNKSYNGN